jgi:hypothetical protein
VKCVRGVDCVRARVHRRGQPWPDKFLWPEKLYEAEGLPPIELISKGCVPPAARYKTVSEHSAVHITPHFF